ncbi:glycosyltransferase family 4 protein [Candidatus Pacearchaeota archaeon]|jgi:glycosyltransferase involved in cell wall biosynthesis|nr:glycosyltransferase family 4 protein [Candidatus Pacearchaeota archaeon]
MKRVLIVAHRWPPRYGGLQNIAFRYAELLSKRFKVSIITSKEKGIKNIKPLKTRLIGVNANPFLYNHFGIPQPLFNLNELSKKMKEEVKKNDVILINDRYYLTSFFAVYFAKKYKKKIITIIHTSIQNYKGVSKILYSFLNYIARYVIANSDHIIGVSSESLKNVLTSYKLNVKSQEVLFNSLEKPELINVKKKNKLNLIFVGRLVDFKGVDIILKIAEKLKEDKGVIFNIIGEGIERGNLEKLKENTGLNNVNFLGPIYSREDMLNQYKKNDVVILLSKKREGFPLSISDALVFGKPIIINENVKIKEFEGFNLGFIEDNNNISKIVKHLLSLKSDSVFYDKTSKEAFRFAKKYLDVEKNINKLSGVINGQDNL